jgi:hypothetical protein
MLVVATLVLLVVCMLISLTSKTMFAQAADQSITLLPNHGLPNSRVVVSGYGFAAGVPVTISFNGETVATTQGYSLYNQLPATEFRVPEVDFGTYDVTASNRDGSATATYTVGNPETTKAPTDRPSDNSPTDSSGTSTTPTPRHTIRPTESSDNSSYLIAGGVIVAIAIIIPLFFVMRGRSSPDSLLDRDREPLREPTPFMSDRYAPGNRPGPPYGSSSSRSNAPTYGRYSTRPTSSSRYGQLSYSQTKSDLTNSTQRTYGRTCPNCRKTIRTDYRVCPHCYKKVG